MRNHGTAFATRHQLVQERVEAMRAIWTQDKAEYHGEFVNFGPMIANPKPVRKPHPPVIVGGAYPYAARRAVQYGDGWYALTGAKYGDEFEFIPKFHDMLANAGRDRSTCPITICLYPDELDAFAPDQVGALARYQELGVDRCIVGLNPDKRDVILPVLDRWAGFMRELRTGAGNETDTRALKGTGLDARRLSFDKIPVIDLAPMFRADAAAKRVLGADLRRACTEIGFFYIRNHSVPQAVIDAAFGVAGAYFAQPDAEKMRNHVSLSKNIRGYAALLEENTDPAARGDLHESFDIALDIPADDPDVVAGKALYGPNQWPVNMPQFRVALEKYQTEMLKLSVHLLHAFALSLGLQEGYFDGFFEKPLATLRVLHYPPQGGTIDDRQIGIGAHSDYECFTVLAQDGVPALQVLNAGGEWIAADPIPGCFVVNVGDQMARWTNDLFASTVHRAINRSGQERYSIPFFFGPTYDTVVEALPSCVDVAHPAKYPPISAGDYINKRFLASFAHYAAQSGIPR
jgi:isopenicillin N synthase-like dioxygenase